MSKAALWALLFQMCAAQNADCSEVAIIEIPNTNIIYVANCLQARYSDGSSGYTGKSTAFHYIGDVLHHKLYLNNTICQKT